jgi:diaminopimelate decarboxylase
VSDKSTRFLRKGEKMQQKLDLFPLDTQTDSGGHLTLQGHRAADLTRQFGTPLYVYSVDTIRRQIDAYRRGLAGYPGARRLTYASKAFLCSALAQLMAAEGVGLDVSSAGELFVAQQGGANPAEIHMHGNNKTTRDIDAALRAGVGRIVVDNTAELERLAAMAAGRQQRMKIWLRVTPDVVVKTHHRYTVTGTTDSKFGLPIYQVETVAGQLLAAGDASPLELTGLHVHLGSHFHDVAAVVRAAERLLDVAGLLHETYQWEMTDLCPGGGWSVRYLPADPPQPVQPFVAGVAQAVAAGCQKRGLPLPTLVLEPGRSLVAQAGVALYTVGGRKVIPGVRTYVSIDGGLADNPRPALYQAGYTALLANRANQPETETVAVAGPFCESGDVLIQSVALPLAAPGDILAVPVAGAYQLSMSSNYNGALKPAVLFIDGAEVRLVQRRETVEDLIRRDTAGSGTPDKGQPQAQTNQDGAS